MPPFPMMRTSWWLDLKLGLRMLVKYPGLALAGGFGIAVGVAIAAGGFSIIYSSFLPSALPIEEGERLVAMEIWDAAASKPERRVLHDYLIWRDSLQSVREIAAFRTVTPNLIAPGAQPESVRVAAMSGSGFRVARVRPLMGRYLADEDERDGAPWVVVIGESVWRNRFGADPAILGRTIQLGATSHAIVGVMPARFAFPVNHRYWTPLRTGFAAPVPVTGPGIQVFGRLAPRATIEGAQAELATVVSRTSVAFPKIYAQLRPRVMPYANPIMGIHENRDVTGLHVMQGIVSLLLVLVCLNVAVLVYSRTAMRQAEIAVRTALGAGRGRIVAQLFIEALVLSGVAAVAGVAIAEFALRQMAAATERIASELPFWVSFHLSPGAVLYAAALSVFAAAIVGVVPAFKATGRRVQAGLRSIGAGGSGMRLGKTWTVLIVAQAGFAVALLPISVSSAWKAMRSGFADPGFAAQEFLSARLGMDDSPGTGAAGTPELTRRFGVRQAELMRRLEAEPRVGGVTWAMVNPGEEATTWIEVEGGSATDASSSSSAESGTSGHEVRFNRVGVDFFRTFDVPILAGRAFDDGDLAPQTIGSATEPPVVVVNRTFAQRMFGGRALGRRVRYVARGRGSAAQDVEAGRWFEIVGVVADFPTGASPGMDDSPLKLYHPAAPGQLQPVTLAIRVRGGDPSGFAATVQAAAASVDPDLHLRDMLGLDEALRREQWIRRMEAAVLAGLTLSVVLLSAAGIYALMSITVSQRRKEIGIRTALGANRKRIVAGIFSRALGQLAVGATVGMAAAAAIAKASGGDLVSDHAAVVLPGVALLMMAVGLLAALGPARRALRIEPTEALREQ